MTPTTASVTDAAVILDGRNVSGATVQQGMHGGLTHFQARVVTQGPLAPGFQMWLHYEQPGGHGGMMGRHGTVMLYDDGTHGDPVAGDGLYCLDDDVGTIGCQGRNAALGDYHYEFYGSGPHGDETNHCDVTVTVAGG